MPQARFNFQLWLRPRELLRRSQSTLNWAHFERKIGSPKRGKFPIRFMQSILAPAKLQRMIPPAVFLAGGVSGKFNWQDHVAEKLRSLQGTLLNPRRPGSHVSGNVVRQINWEFRAIRHANIIAFWFEDGELNPITLFEFGEQLQRLAMWPRHERNARPQLIVAASPRYLKLSDVVVRAKLLAPRMRISNSLDDMIEMIRRSVTG
jgi:hypothetical protein